MLGGYTLVTADNLDAAVALTDRCPAPDYGGGVEVGALLELNRGTRPINRFAPERTWPGVRQLLTPP